MKTLVVLLVASGTALADARYHRTDTVKIEVTQSARAQPPPRTAKDDAKPIDSSALLELEGKVEPIRQGVEDGLRDLIARTPDSDVDDKADLYFRLAEVLGKQQRYHRLESVKAQIAKRADLAARHADEAKRYMFAAVRAFQDLTSNAAFAHYPRMDVALFHFGYMLANASYVDEARAVYEKLVKHYPASKYVAEAQFAFGEYYFEHDQLADAEARYKAVIALPGSKPYWYAMYKLAWIDLGRRRFQSALETFFQIATATKANAKDATLHRAAMKDFVRAYAEIGKADKAFPAFERVDRAEAFGMLQTLADLYLAQGKSDKAIFVYRELMRRAPRHKDVCRWQHDVARAMMTLPGASVGDRVREIELLAKLWTALAARRDFPAAERQDCRDDAAAMTSELARTYHSEAAKTKNVETLAYAERLYRAYLATFPDAADAADMQYYYAELLWLRAEATNTPRAWEIAASAFAELVKAGKARGARVKVAAYAAVLGWKNAFDVDIRALGKEAEKADASETGVPKPRPIGEREQKMLAAFDLYIEHVKNPDDDELVRLKFITANTLRRYDHLDEALPIFLDIVAHHRKHETAEFAANLALDTYNRLGQHDKLLALVDALAKDTAFLADKPDLAGRLAVLRYQGLENAAHALEDEAKRTRSFAKYVECGRAFLAVFNSNPEYENGDRVLYNAGVCFAEGRSISVAIEVFARVERQYAKSPLAARATAQLGKLYADVALYDKAADKLEEYARKYAGETDATLIRPYDAMWDAVAFRKGLGDHAKAIDDTRYFIATFGKKHPDEAASASFALTDVYEKLAANGGDSDAVVNHLRGYIRTFGDKGGADRLVVAYAKIGQIYWSRSCPVKTVDGTCAKVTRERAATTRRIARASSGRDTHCPGSEQRIHLTVVPRDAASVRAALDAFRDAERVYDKLHGQTGGDVLAARHYYGIAKSVEADVEYEKFLAIAFPANLTFHDGDEAMRKKSVARFDAWLVGKGKAAGEAARAFDRVIAIKDAANTIAAAARIAQINQQFADELFTAEIPEVVRTGAFAADKIDAYCTALEDKAIPLSDRAVELYDQCLARSTELGWSSEWSRLCERELGQIKPDSYPTSREIHAAPAFAGAIVAVEPQRAP